MNCELTIVGCGSAKPTRKHKPSSQVLDMRSKQFMIDCGEGTQANILNTNLHINRLDNIFISHLHGDHCFGLIGLISTFALYQRRKTLNIFGPPDLEKVFQPMLDYFCRQIDFTVSLQSFSPYHSTCIYEDRTVKVSTIPLKHRVPCCGFLFEETLGERHIKPDMIEYYHIPRSKIKDIKQGADFQTEDGEMIQNKWLTTDPTPAVRYAYCSDTVYSEKIVPLIEGTDLLFHEATYTDDRLASARDNMHSTATQAATIAKLANVKQLIIGHYSSTINDEDILLEQAKKIFENTILANEGLKIRF
ncbi:MAG: ribonuclease Z [Paludibacteraceae bacterium]|nr:ribonuclease Z [Paludibacteraceae bacterium]